MSGTEDQSKSGSVRFPFINLETALGRAKQLFDADPKGREMAVVAGFVTWQYSEKSSGGFQTVSALKEYGLLKAAGTGKIQLTPEALTYFRDERESEHERLRKYFAHSPRLVQKLWTDSQWGTSPPADPVARSHLKNEIGLSEQSTRSFLAIYKENIAFAGFKGDDKVLGSASHGKGVNPPPRRLVEVKIGDFVQWTSNGVDQLPKPARVVWISEDGTHLRMHGSMTGIPVAEVAVVEAQTATHTDTVRTGRAGSAYAGQDGELTVLLKGNRLEITADVDRAGLDRLLEILRRYEGILDLLAPEPSHDVSSE